MAEPKCRCGYEGEICDVPHGDLPMIAFDVVVPSSPYCIRCGHHSGCHATHQDQQEVV